MKRYADMMRIGFNTEIEVSSDKVLWSSFFTQVYFSQQLFRRGYRKVICNSWKKNPLYSSMELTETGISIVKVL